jgi:8-oxo-dGTP diphosphatase
VNAVSGQGADVLSIAPRTPARHASPADAARAEMRGPLPKHEFDWIYSRVPRLTVELVITSPDRGVLLQLRDADPCKGTWSLPGGTVRFGEPALQATARVARDELGLTVIVGHLLGYIEYPSHYNNGLDSPVGLAFSASILGDQPTPRSCEWFTTFPANMHPEQKAFLARHVATVR